MGKETEKDPQYQCRCSVQVSKEHLSRLNALAESINGHLQLVNIPLDASHVLQLLLNQHLEKIGNELVEFSALKSHQSGQQVDPVTITYSLNTDRKKIH